MICREKKRKIMNPEPKLAINPAPLPQPPPKPREEESLKTLGSCPGSFKEKTLSKNAYITASRSQSSIEEVLTSWLETGNNAKTPGNKRDVHILTVVGRAMIVNLSLSAVPSLLNSRKST